MVWKGFAPAERLAVESSLLTILRTQPARYLHILLWALAIAATAGWAWALAWWIVTMAIGLARYAVERSKSKKLAAGEGQSGGNGFGVAYLAIATASCGVWALAPLVTWFQGGEFGHLAAVILVAAGYQLVITQFRASPWHATLVSAPYSLVVALFFLDSFGQISFWPVVTAFAALYVAVLTAMVFGYLAHRNVVEAQAAKERLIQELGKARDAAEAANRAKSAFLAMISHELRTPMNGVLGAVQLLDKTKLDENQREFLGIAKGSGESLLTLLNDVLDISKIEADRVELESIEVDLPGLIKRLETAWRPQARAKDLRFKAVIEGEMPGTVRGDPTRLTQILQNLLANAVKFTDTGEVGLTIRSRKICEERAALELAVHDTGVGIPEDAMVRLFEPFSQVDASTTRRFGGTGLGLAISRRLARLHGGDITCVSAEGEGSTFTVHLEVEVLDWRAAAVSENYEDDALAGEARSLDILVVEDNAVNRQIIAAFLSPFQHRLETAENGAEALERLRTRQFDLVLMDVHMPVLDGISATKVIRAGEAGDKDVPIIMLTASAMREERAEGVAAGADAYATKPIDGPQLYRLIAKAAQGRGALAECEAAA